MKTKLGPITLTTALALALTGAALAEPPKVGTTHAFVDPIFRGTVFCDTREQVEEIAGAADVDRAYATYLLTANAIGEPTCMAMMVTAEVLEVTPLGIMTKGKKDFDAWVIEADVGGIVAYVLYIESRPDIWA